MAEVTPKLEDVTGRRAQMFPELDALQIARVARVGDAA